jgi:3-hydroxyisobutyrate dehydrogenase-like beta-hydroxyacid dehydrogenase
MSRLVLFDESPLRFDSPFLYRTSLSLMPMRIGFVGLGQMGAAMAERLLNAGHTLAVYNRTAQRAEHLRDRGAVVAETPEAAARGAEVVITMLADDAAVEHVVFSADGILEALDTGAVHVSASTISVALSRRLAEAHTRSNQRYVAAPVFGRPDAAAAGRLFVVVAGPDDVVPRLQPIFDAYGQRTYRFGTDASAANLVKLTGNFLLQSAIESMAEAFALIRKGGVDVSAFKDLLATSFLNAPLYHTYGDLLVAGKDEPALFSVPLALKDVKLAIGAAESARVPMPVASVIHDAFVSAMARGYEHRDQAVLGRVAAENAGVSI